MQLGRRQRRRQQAMEDRFSPALQGDEIPIFSVGKGGHSGGRQLSSGSSRASWRYVYSRGLGLNIHDQQRFDLITRKYNVACII